MVKSSYQGGFTLVEVTLVMAIGGALAALVFLGQSQLGAQARFTNAVQQTKSFVLGVRNEANTTVSIRPGNAYDRVFFGKAIKFDTANPTTLKVTTLYKDSTGALQEDSTVDTSTYTMPNGLKYDVGASYTTTTTSGGTTLSPALIQPIPCMYLVYARVESSADPITYLIPSSTCTTSVLTTTSVYSQATSTAPQTIPVIDADNRQAYFIVRPTSGVFDETIR
jgi:prepilin-type N-terminal cleavage/methylation domain-containing protein